MVVLGHRAFHQVEHGLVQGHVDHLALARAAPAGGITVAQRHQRADHAVQRGDRVADRNADPHRRPVRVPRHVADAAHALADRAKARLVAHRTSLAVAGQPHHDRGRIQRPQLLVAEAPLFEHAGPVVLDHDVGVAGQPLRNLLRTRILQIQRDRALVARLHVPPKRGAVVQMAPRADRIATVGGLDLDHVGAELRHHARRERAGDQRAQLEHLDPGQRSAHGRARRVALPLGHAAPPVTNSAIAATMPISQVIERSAAASAR